MILSLSFVRAAHAAGGGAEEGVSEIHAQSTPRGAYTLILKDLYPSPTPYDLYPPLRELDTAYGVSVSYKRWEDL